LFAEEPASPPLLAPQEKLERLRREYIALGFLCAPHPISLVRGTIERLVQACDLATCVGRTIRFAGWLLTGKMVSTKTGEVMEFLTFEDETGLVETTFFPEVYRRYAHLLSSGKPFLLNGLVEEDYGAPTLTVDRVAVLQTAGKVVSS
jgi:DNA polymerase-3 subunit alpha/error-prone DNA polymerase